MTTILFFISLSMQCIVWQPSTIWKRRKKKKKKKNNKSDATNEWWLIVYLMPRKFYHSNVVFLFSPFLFWLLTGKFYETLSMRYHSMWFSLNDENTLLVDIIRNWFALEIHVNNLRLVLRSTNIVRSVQIMRISWNNKRCFWKCLQSFSFLNFLRFVKPCIFCSDFFVKERIFAIKLRWAMCQSIYGRAR